jgi:hypothetical protein
MAALARRTLSNYVQRSTGLPGCIYHGIGDFWKKKYRPTYYQHYYEQKITMKYIYNLDKQAFLKKDSNC